VRLVRDDESMTQNPQLRTGKRPAQPARPHLRLASGLTALPAPPAQIIYDAVPDWGMQGNDTVGDCVEAYVAHAIEQISLYANGSVSAVATADTIRLYSAITGYRPSDPSTDQGTNMQDAFTYWRKKGVFGGHKIAAFAAVSLANWSEIENAVAMFGAAGIGFNFPASAMDQFNAGQPWTVVRGSEVDGGHCVMLIGYDADWLYVVTWGKVQRMDRKFWATYVDEAWVPITREVINSKGLDAFGGVLDLASLGAAFATLTGEPNPFPSPQPAPTPVPTPAPAPQPVPAAVTAADVARALRKVLSDLGL
jgi:hypothetical protein